MCLSCSRLWAGVFVDRLFHLISCEPGLSRNNATETATSSQNEVAMMLSGLAGFMAIETSTAPGRDGSETRTTRCCAIPAVKIINTVMIAEIDLSALLGFFLQPAGIDRTSIGARPTRSTLIASGATTGESRLSDRPVLSADRRFEASAHLPCG